LVDSRGGQGTQESWFGRLGYFIEHDQRKGDNVCLLWPRQAFAHRRLRTRIPDSTLQILALSGGTIGVGALAGIWKLTYDFLLDHGISDRASVVALTRTRPRPL
jgi:hypothetical protein